MANTPKDVYNTCLEYYDGDNENHPDVWYENWGDEIIVGNEVWDDGNRKSGDGCDVDCRNIEDEFFVCYIKDGDTKNTCIECTHLQYRNSEESKWLNPEDSDSINKKLKAIYAMVAIGIALNIAYAFFTRTSFQSWFTLINFLQLCTLFVLFETPLSFEVYQYLKGFSVFLFNYSFGKVEYPDWDPEKIKLQMCKYMEEIGYTSRSAIANLFAPIIVFGSFLLIHLVVLIIYFQHKRKLVRNLFVIN